MALIFRNYYGTGNVQNNNVSEVPLLTGASGGGTIVKSLQIITGNESCYVEIIRKVQITGTNNYNYYATIPLELKANDYLLLWQGFFVIPSYHILSFKADSNQCKVIANVVEMS